MRRQVRQTLITIAIAPILAGSSATVARSITDALGTAVTASGGLGASIPLHPVIRRSGCRVRGPLPDAGCTPGTRYRLVDKQVVCSPGYAGRVRHVPQSRKDAVYRAYGIKR